MPANPGIITPSFPIYMFSWGGSLAWLEVVGILGAIRGAVVVLEQLILWLQEVCLGFFQHNLMLTFAINQVSGDEELFDTARDYFNFVTTFLESINLSAVHVTTPCWSYPLCGRSPDSGTITCNTPFSRVMTGAQG